MPASRVMTVAFATLIIAGPTVWPAGPVVLAQSWRHRWEMEQARGRMQVQAEQRRREMQREFERRKRELQAGQRPGSSRSGSPLPRATPSKPSAESTFDPAVAPRPQDCFKKFVLTARKAHSMRELLPLLQRSERELLEAEQAQYDPQAVQERRARLQKLDPGITEDSLDHLTGAPFDRTLKWYKSIAADVIDLLSVRIDGDKAYLSVSIHARAKVNGEEYPFGTATVTLVGEDNFWRIEAYSEGVLVYKDQPQ